MIEKDLNAILTDDTLAVIVRHHKERKSKCSLEPLVGDRRFQFVKFVPDLKLRADGFLLLSVDCPILAGPDLKKPPLEDVDETPDIRTLVAPLLILDSTWRYLPQLEAAVTGQNLRRSLPRELRTAYPRTSKIQDDPSDGLASIEALYATLRILGHREDSLLDQYHWRGEFLRGCSSVFPPEH